MVCPTSLMHPTIFILHHNLYFVPLSKQLADLQKGGALGFRDHHPNVDECGEADESKDDEAVGPQTFLLKAHKGNIRSEVLLISCCVGYYEVLWVYSV